MNTRRNFEIKIVITALTVVAAFASGILTAADANAAPPTKKSTVTVTRAKKSKPVYVKMSGSRRAAATRAAQLYSDALAQKEAAAQAAEEQRLAAQEAAANANQTAQNNTQTGQSGPFYDPTIIAPTYGGNQNVFTYPGLGGFGPIVVGGYGGGAYGASTYSTPSIYGGYGNSSGFSLNGNGFSYGNGFTFGF